MVWVGEQALDVRRQIWGGGEQDGVVAAGRFGPCRAQFLKLPPGIDIIGSGEAGANGSGRGSRRTSGPAAPRSRGATCRRPRRRRGTVRGRVLARGSEGEALDPGSGGGEAVKRGLEGGARSVAIYPAFEDCEPNSGEAGAVKVGRRTAGESSVQMRRVLDRAGQRADECRSGGRAPPRRRAAADHA